MAEDGAPALVSGRRRVSCRPVCVCVWVCVVTVCRGGACRSPWLLPLPCGSAPSDQVVFFEVELQDGVFDGREDKADVLRVGGTGEVRVDDLVAVWVQVHKHLEDKLSSCLSISLRTWMEKVRHTRALNILRLIYIYSIFETYFICQKEKINLSQRYSKPNWCCIFIVR